MAANAAAAEELQRVEENSKGSPIQALELALRRAPSPSSRADLKGEWPSIRPISEPPQFLKYL